MSDVELEVTRGSFHFRGRGPKEWVEEKYEAIVGATLSGERYRAGEANSSDAVEGLLASDGNGTRAARWMAQNQISEQQLGHIFHREGERVEFILVSLPGRNAKERCHNAYVLTGLRNVLLGGDGQFSDEEARTICSQYGDYNCDNHSKILSGLKPDVAGAKNTGWQLTAPGLAKAATLIKELAGTPA